MSIMILGSCSIINRGFIVRHKTKKINLKGIEDSVKIGYETDSAIVYFGLKDIKEVANDILVNDGLDQYDNGAIEMIQIKIADLDKINSSFNVNHINSEVLWTDLDKYKLSCFINDWVFKKLIFKKKAEVFNKEKKIYETQIVYHFVRDRLGSESCYYTFNDGKQFHYQMITLGE